MLVESSGLISTTWVLGWYLYSAWMGICGLWFGFVLSFLTAVQGGDWRATYMAQTATCQQYIQTFI